MARLKVTGLDELENKLKAIEKGLRGEAMQNMLYAGADVLINAWKGSIQQKHHYRSHAMEDNVDKTSIHTAKDGLEISVYPMGTDSHRISNAQKAYILNYGRHAHKKGKEKIEGDKFVTDAEKTAKPQIYAAMQNALNEYISGK